MDFGEALKELRAGRRVTRAGWHGAEMYVRLMQACHVRHNLMLQPFLYLRTPSGAYVPWSVSQTDVLAEDWDVLE